MRQLSTQNFADNPSSNQLFASQMHRQILPSHDGGKQYHQQEFESIALPFERIFIFCQHFAKFLSFQADFLTSVYQQSSIFLFDNWWFESFFS